MKRSLLVVGFALSGLCAATVATIQDRPAVGARLAVKDTYLDRKANLGFGMFAIRWRPDPGRAFNEVSCAMCHDNPIVGGAGINPIRQVFMVPNETDPSGWSNYRRNFRRESGKVDKMNVPDYAVKRKSPALYGLGLIDAIPSETILANADPLDANKDGISGRLYKLKDGRYGKFGWKSSVPTLQDFITGAFETEIGIKPFDPKTNPDGQMDEHQMDATFWFVKLLAPPDPSFELPKQEAGKALFEKVGCVNCHRPELKTGKSDVPELSEKVIRLYSDLLLHDMGEGNLHAAPAKPSKREVRTPPLWGLGVQKGAFLHDESAKTIEEAIQKHGGEAKPTSERFTKLEDKDKQALLDFLKCL